MLAGTYAGIANVEPLVVDAARAMGMTESQVLLRVEIPNALPLILGGLRNATLQIVATATVAAYASLGGLGRYLIDGIKVREFQLALVGALMVAALALILDGLLASAVWVSVPGTGRLRKMSAAEIQRTQLPTSLPAKPPRRSDPYYGRSVNAAPSDPARLDWPAMLTWRAQDVSRMESVRMQLSGKRIKANGRIVAAATATNPAFGAFYEMQTDESGATKRFGLTVTWPSGNVSSPSPVTRRTCGWSPTTRARAARPTTARSTSTWCSARSSTRCRSAASACMNVRTSITLPMVYVNVPEMSVTAAP